MPAPAALPATAVWEFRTTGASDNAGIFDSANPGGAGVDYSQRDTPILTLTDCTMTAGGTTLHSDTGGFTEAMENNWCHLSGTHFTTGRRKIATYIDTNNVTLCSDATDGTNGESGTCKVGGGIYEVNGTNLDALMDLVQAGNTLYIKAGTYTITTANIGAGTAGTTTLPVNMIGYYATRGDAPTGANCPLIDMGSYTWPLWYNWTISYLRRTGTATAVFVLDDHGMARGCSAQNTSSTSGRKAFQQNNGTVSMIDCEASSLAGIGFSAEGTSHRLVGCWAHDCNVGINTYTNAAIIDRCLIEQCVQSIAATSASGVYMIGNTIVGCGTGVYTSGAAQLWLLLNNIITHNTTGANWAGGTNYGLNIADYNNWYGNGTDVTNLTKGANDTADDPAFAALHSWTDLVVSAGSNVVITSVTGGFDTYYEAGDYIWIDAATDWTSGCYRIVSVDSANQLTLATSPAAVNTTGGIARTIRTAVGVSDCTPGAASDVLTQGLGLSLGVGA